MADDDRNPDDDLPELFRQLFGQAGMGGDQLAELQKMGFDPAMIQRAMQQLQGAMASAGEGGISWDAATTQALHIANKDGAGITAADRSAADDAFTLASLWLGEATTISDLPGPGVTMTRGGWVEATLPVWQELAEPVATSIADAFTAALQEQSPPEMQQMIAGAGRVMRTIGGSLFAAQLGTVVGNLSTEVVSGGDVGIPLLPDGQAAVVPQNYAQLAKDLEIPDDQFALYIATRELAHARLFRHARWLRLHVLSQVSDFARGVRVDWRCLSRLRSTGSMPMARPTRGASTRRHSRLRSISWRARKPLSGGRSMPRSDTDSTASGPPAPKRMTGPNCGSRCTRIAMGRDSGSAEATSTGISLSGT